MQQVYNYINNTGTIIPDFNVILQQVIDEYSSSFGGELTIYDSNGNFIPSTPQGIIISAEANARYSAAINNAQLANQINPNLAGGEFLYSIGALTGLSPTLATYSTVVITLGGQPGTLIPTSVQISDSSEEVIFQLLSSVTIPPSGTINGNFICIIPGPFAAPTGTLTNIYNGVIGLETASNTQDASLGESKQTDQSFRKKIKETLFLNAMSVSGAILSTLNSFPEIKSSSYQDNVKNTSELIRGVTMLPRSIYVCADVQSVNYQLVANSIYNNKSAGANYTNGASATPVSVSVTDPYSGQVSNVLFDVPDKIPILVKVTVSQGSFSGNLVVAIQEAILAYANGDLDSFQGFIIGNSVSCFQLSVAIGSQIPGIFLHNVQTSLITPVSFSNAEIPISIFQVATIQVSSITVVII